MHIHATIENIIYKPTLCSPLETFSVKEFLSGEAFTRGSFLLDFHGNELAVSYWTSSKRTRTYPYARVYDTMNKHKRVTIIPFVKDEGKDGDRDFIQWDSVSLMSLLGVYVIIGYYVKAKKSERKEQKEKDKITEQDFDYHYLHTKLQELEKYKSDALHWNLKQLDQIEEAAKKAKNGYLKIARTTGVTLHSVTGIDRRIKMLQKKVEAFKTFSRDLAAKAQDREYRTVQPKESLIEEKAKITIKNYLGGEYRLTVDEIVIKENKIYLIEKKNSDKSVIPGISDIKDGFLRMILFTNLSKVMVDGKKFEHYPVLGLTSKIFSDHLDSLSDKIDDGIMNAIFEEGRQNNFLIFLINHKDQTRQRSILEQYVRSR
jgi:hypothetical protein